MLTTTDIKITKQKMTYSNVRMGTIKKFFSSIHIIKYKLSNDKYNINLQVKYNLYQDRQMIFYSYNGIVYNKDKQYVNVFEIKLINNQPNTLLEIKKINTKNKRKFMLYSFNNKLNKQETKQLETEILNWMVKDDMQKSYILAHKDYAKTFGV